MCEQVNIIYQSNASYGFLNIDSRSTLQDIYIMQTLNMNVMYILGIVGILKRESRVGSELGWRYCSQQYFLIAMNNKQKCNFFNSN